MDEQVYRLRCSLLGHSKDVRAVATAHFPEGGIVTGSRDGTTRIWAPNESNSRYSETHCLTGPTNFISSVCCMPPSDQFPSGLILVGSHDCAIYCYNLQSSTPLYKLLGHSAVVCSLAAGQFGTLLSGSWDKTARVWHGQKCVMTLEGHQGSVWAVQILPKQGLMLTGSADKSIRLWRNGKCEHEFNGHEDCVRALAIVSTMEFLSASNDGTVRHWETAGNCLHVYTGHTNFVYSLVLIPDSDYFATCGEDRSLRVWRRGVVECVQTIRLPAQSVWCVSALPNGDIVVGSSDGIARVFTRDPALQAPSEEQRVLEEEVSKSALPAQEIAGLKLNELPGKESLFDPGNRDGQTKLVRDGSLVSAYQWSAADGEWRKIGDVVGAPDGSEPTGGKVVFEGKEYDYVFDVDLDGERSLKLPYNLSEDPWFAAQAFIHKNELSQYYLDQVANFIVKNTKGMVLESSPGPTHSDPFTGSSRYIPRGTSQTDPNANATGGANGAAGDIIGSSDDTSPTSYFPINNFLRFDIANTQGILAKLKEFNTQVPPENIIANEQHLINAMGLTNVNTQPDDEQMATLEKILDWPKDYVFPALDLLRLAIRGAAVNERVCRQGAVQLISRLLSLLPTSPANQMLALRVLSNMFCHAPGEALAVRERERVLNVASKHCVRGNKNTQIGLATLFLNYCVAYKAGRIEFQPDANLELLGSMANILPDLTDGEAQFRLVVALGTLLHGDATLIQVAEQLDLTAISTKLLSVSDPSKVAHCVRQLIQLIVR